MNLNYFIESIPNIESNEELREPQIEAYQAVYDHFVVQKSNEHAIVVLPTGVGKTGLMGILPFGISYGRVLIITPQLVIKERVLDSLDPEHPKNFWLARKVFEKFHELPSVIEYNAKTSGWELKEANIVILNVHKLQERLRSSLINKVPPDFFDMIIIDEAHHSTAPTWERTLEYFSKAKVVKLTGTPYRSDGEEIPGKYVYKYPLSKAMANGYIKTLERVHYIPDSLYLTLDKNDNTLYTIEQIRELNLKDDDWISRSVAYSKECSMKVVEASINLLQEKRASGLPHKIIGVACSIWHAEQLQELYESKGMRVAVVHSDLPQDVLNRRLADIENHKVEVVLNVAKLGEGYDHKYLSVAAIFRPFRHRLPYEQFVGRVLRAIETDEIKSPEDNIACVVHHKELGLDKLWEFYKQEKEKSDIIKWMRKESAEDKFFGPKISKRTIEKNTGLVFEQGEGRLEKDTFIDTELLKERERREKIQKEKLARLKEILPNYPDEILLQMIKREEEGVNNSKILRPDKFLNRKRRNLDERIKEEIVPELLLEFNIDKESDNLKNSSLFKSRKYAWIPKNKGIKNNGGFLAAYIEYRINELIGNSNRETWSPEEYDMALKHAEELFEYIRKVLESDLRG